MDVTWNQLLQSNPQGSQVSIEKIKQGFTDKDLEMGRLYESEKEYNKRIELNNILRKSYGTRMDGPTIDIVSSAIINKAKYGLQYSPEIERIIQGINM